VALNTFFGNIAGAPLNPPEAIRLFSTPEFARLTAYFARPESLAQFRWLYDFQVGGFIEDADVRRTFVPLLFRQFEDQPSSIDAFMQLNADLIAAVLAATERTDEMRQFPAPVRVAFGANDRYLTTNYGEALAGLFPHGEATPITGATHFPQLDAPTAVAHAILTTHNTANEPTT
jgi:pimeloyl-ACP methyl ester carboxylesterase